MLIPCARECLLGKRIPALQEVRHPSACIGPRVKVQAELIEDERNRARVELSIVGDVLDSEGCPLGGEEHHGDHRLTKGLELIGGGAISARLVCPDNLPRRVAKVGHGLAVPALHGVTDRDQIPIREPEVIAGRVRLSFITVADISGRPTMTRNTPTGTMRVSTPEVTLLDLVSMPRRGGGLSNVVTIAGEMLEEGVLDSQALAVVAEQYPGAARSGPVGCWSELRTSSMSRSPSTASRRLPGDGPPPLDCSPAGRQVLSTSGGT